MKCKKCKNNITQEGKLHCEACLIKKRNYLKNHRKELKEKGLCECGNVADGSLIYCKQCLIKQKNKKKQIIASGLCLDCRFNNVEPHKKRCSSCLDVKKNKRKEQKSKGICQLCFKNPIVDKKTMCEKCIDSKKQKKTKLFANGICVHCHKNPTTDSTYCRTCLDFFKKKRETFDKKGLCVKCGQCRLQRSKNCEKCYLKETSYRHFGKVEHWEKLKDIFNEQNGICPYSGESLSLGENTDLDHLIPKSQGGQKKLENVQWVYSVVNKMKWTSSEDEFLKLIEKIYNFRLKNK